jgi:hypothetical protein
MVELWTIWFEVFVGYFSNCFFCDVNTTRK